MGTAQGNHAMAKDQRSSLSVVKIAMGVVLGLLIIKACGRYEHAQVIKQANAEIAKLVDFFPKPGPAQTRAQREDELEQQGRKLEHAPLQADERCVDGQRFRHVNNEWVQNGSC